MKTIFIGMLVLATLLTGCTPSATEANYPVRPPELQDCKIYRLTNADGGSITVARCPNSTTTANYKNGKTSAATITVDGVAYVRAAK